MRMIRTEVAVDPEIAELVPGFSEARIKDLQNISLLLSNNDFQSIERICHSIKGVARPYGFPTLETIARQLEAAANAKDVTQSKHLLEQFRKYLKSYSP